MQPMRDLMRSSLGRALRELAPLDRVAAAWPVAAGTALAAHGTVAAVEDGVVTVAVVEATWRAEMVALRRDLLAELGRASGVPLREIHFRDGTSRGVAGSPWPPRRPRPGGPQGESRR